MHICFVYVFVLVSMYVWVLFLYKSISWNLYALAARSCVTNDSVVVNVVVAVVFVSCVVAELFNKIQFCMQISF